MNNEFKEIPEFDNYFINKDGVVISKRSGKTMILKPFLNEFGYFRIRLYKKKIGITLFVSRLVALTFIKNTMQKPHVAHKDGNRTNNNINNLYWATAKENCFDKIKHGTHQIGSKNPFSKLTEKDVLAIKKLRSEKVEFKIIANKFNVKPCTIHNIIYGRSWKHLK